MKKEKIKFTLSLGGQHNQGSACFMLLCPQLYFCLYCVPFSMSVVTWVSFVSSSFRPSPLQHVLLPACRWKITSLTRLALESVTFTFPAVYLNLISLHLHTDHYLCIVSELCFVCWFLLWMTLPFVDLDFALPVGLVCVICICLVYNHHL